MKVASKVDMSGMHRAIEHIARYSGVPIDRVVQEETTKVLETAVRRTPAAKAAKLQERSKERKWIRIDGKLYKLSNRYPDSVWSRLEVARAISLEKKLKARGVTKQAFLQLAREAGLSIKAPSFVSKAIPTTGEVYNNAAVRRQRVRGHWAYFFSTTQPTLQSPHVDGGSIVIQALRGREKYFQRNVEKGVFGSLKQIQRAYPGVFGFN